MEEGYVMITIGQALDGWHQFNGMEMADGGYLRQEVDRMTGKKAI